ncbi:MAG: hypothetical protein P8R42_28740 [Candidatus Binatia bacterium]|nr:hypothetical protein [Candidatus Binatia bacterium]
MATKMPEGLDWKSLTPDDSPLTPDDLHADAKMIDLSTATVEADGPAFDFELPLFDYSGGTKQETGKTFHLSEVSKNRPVALIFGSHT